MEHRKGAPSRLKIAVLTVSDSRSAAMRDDKDEDISGKQVEQRLHDAGHTSTRIIVPDEVEQILAAMKKFISDQRIDAVITVGGTGITKRDVTIETLRPLFEKELLGFGEILRHLGYQKVGGPAILTRATAGLIERKPVFCLPGAPNAVVVAMDLILPELGHLVKHARE